MILKADKEARQAIAAMADLALKYAGIQALQVVNQINSCCQAIEEEEKKAEA